MIGADLLRQDHMWWSHLLVLRILLQQHLLLVELMHARPVAVHVAGVIVGHLKGVHHWLVHPWGLLNIEVYVHMGTIHLALPLLVCMSLRFIYLPLD